MKKITIALCSLFFVPAMAQDHFGALSTSKRVSILNGNMNPSEFANLNSTIEVQILGVSVNASNSRVKINDLFKDDTDFESLLFSGTEGVDFNADVRIALPGVAFKAFGWGFAITGTGNIKANVNE